MNIDEKIEWAKRVQGRYLELKHGIGTKVIGWGYTGDNIMVTLHLEGEKPNAFCVGSGFNIRCWVLCHTNGMPYILQPTNEEFLTGSNWEYEASKVISVGGEVVEKACSCPLENLMSLGCNCGGI